MERLNVKAPTPMNEALERLKLATTEFKETSLPSDDARWDIPFPMGVFGTLRSGCGNNTLMHRGEVELHVRAFMPHYVAHGLSISYRKGATAPFEAFFYRPEEWKKMIPRVDSLEGFDSKYAGDKREYGYFRTLAWLHLLPEEYTHPMFPGDKDRMWSILGSGERNLEIPESEWSKYERVPCWVYSSRGQNRKAREGAGAGTVIWG